MVRIWIRLPLGVLLAALLLGMAGCSAYYRGNPVTQTPVPQTPLVPTPPAVSAPPNLSDTTALLVGAGQTETVRVDDMQAIQRLLGALAETKVAAEQAPAGSLAYIAFRAKEQHVAQLWVVQDKTQHQALAVRFEGEQTWLNATPALQAALQPLLRQIPSLKMP